MKTICKLHHPGRMTIGLEFPLDNDWSLAGDQQRKADGRPFGVPNMRQHAERAQLADQLGFNTLWLREVPVYDPNFGDGAQLFDTLSYLGYLAGITENVLLGTAAIVLPLHHPVTLAKGLATIENVSNSRLLAGVGLGDRPLEFPVLGVDFKNRDQLFRHHFEVVNEAWKTEHNLQQYYSNLSDQQQVYPKPQNSIPWIVAGRAQQSMEWIAQNANGWFNYPRPVPETRQMVLNWKNELFDQNQPDKPYLTAFHLNLTKDPNAAFQPGRFGGSVGINNATELFNSYQEAGVAHIAIHLRKSETPVEEAIQQLGEVVLPHFKNEMKNCIK